MRCLLTKFHDCTDFTKRLAKFTGDPHSFCDELERVTGGIVVHETRKTSPELFPSPKSTYHKPSKVSTPEEQGPSQSPAAAKVKARKRKGTTQEDQGPSKKQKDEPPTADIDAEVQKHYIGEDISICPVTYSFCCANLAQKCSR